MPRGAGDAGVPIGAGVPVGAGLLMGADRILLANSAQFLISSTHVTLLTSLPGTFSCSLCTIFLITRP